jgi:hypothetical protein
MENSGEATVPVAEGVNMVVMALHGGKAYQVMMMKKK